MDILVLMISPTTYLLFFSAVMLRRKTGAYLREERLSGVLFIYFYQLLVSANRLLLLYNYFIFL